MRSHSPLQSESHPCVSESPRYLRHPGALNKPLAPWVYQRRKPEETVLYDVVSRNLSACLSAAQERSENGFGYPRFVEREFKKFLDCGQLRQGLVRVKCAECPNEKIVAFSCKGRGFCPSCTARRMSDTAAHMVDKVLLRAPIVLRPQNFLEVSVEKRVGVVDEMCGIAQEAVYWIGQVPCDLFHPGAIGIDANTRDVNLASLKLDDKEHHVPDSPKDSQGFDGKEVAGVEGVPVRVNKLLPRSVLVALRRRDNACFIEDIGNGGAADIDAESHIDGVSDFRVAPAEVVIGDSENQSSCFFWFARSSWSPARFGAVVFLGVDPAKRLKNCPRPNELATLVALFGRLLFALSGKALCAGCR